MSHTLISGPHTLATISVSRTMLWVVAALLPATAWGCYLFGWPAINTLLLCIASALAFEALCQCWAGQPVGNTLADGSALLTGWLLALCLPPWAPWWLSVSGSFMAIVIGKQVFGGLGQNLFNPAMVARVALLISFPLQMTQWVAVAPLFSAAAPGFVESLAITFGGQAVDGFTGASPLGHLKTEMSNGKALSQLLVDAPSAEALFWGTTRGSLGETSAALLLAGGLLLMWLGIVRWTIPVSLLATLAALAALFHGLSPERYLPVSHHLLSAATMMVAFFIATDIVTSPNTTAGQLLFGAGCAALIFAIRSWGSFPEGAAFAVLLMNALTPLIDHYLKPRIFGRDKQGHALPVKSPSVEQRS